jgi:hypothetical protein
MPGGFSSYACVPAAYSSAVMFNTPATTATEIGGLSAENVDGISFEEGRIRFANPEHASVVNNLTPGGAVFTLSEGVLLQLTGKSGALGGNVWNGPGTLEITRGAVVRTGQCARWGGGAETRCVEGTPAVGQNGLLIKNQGVMYGAGISLCRNGAGHPARLENEGSIQMFLSGGFDTATECGEVGSVVNGASGVLGLARLDGGACNVQIHIASLSNSGFVRLGSCTTPETAEVQRPTVELGSSLSEAGTIVDGGIVHVHGNYTPGANASLTIHIGVTLPQGAPNTNYGTVKVDGSVALAGELNIATTGYLSFAPTPGQTFQIVDAGEVSGALSGEFTLGSHCILTEPGFGYAVHYKQGIRGTVTIEVAKLADC